MSALLFTSFVKNGIFLDERQRMRILAKKRSINVYKEGRLRKLTLLRAAMPATTTINEKTSVGRTAFSNQAGRRRNNMAITAPIRSASIRDNVAIY
jgi:hypothetical protein